MASFIKQLKVHLERNGMSITQAQAVIERMVSGEADSSMPTRWQEDTGDYPPMLYNLIWGICKTYALKYIDSECPMAWFRPCYLPEAEQREFLRKEQNAALLTGLRNL